MELTTHPTKAPASTPGLRHIHLKEKTMLGDPIADAAVEVAFGADGWPTPSRHWEVPDSAAVKAGTADSIWEGLQFTHWTVD